MTHFHRLVAILCVACGGSQAVARGGESIDRSEADPLVFTTSRIEAQRLRGVFVVRRPGQPDEVSDPVLAQTRFEPASTFKIPNTLIALEANAVADEHEVLPWNGEHHDIETWNADTDLERAIANSTVWFYQALARRVGLARMQSFVRQFRYGNMLVGESVDTFWLRGPLTISPVEQVDFLARLNAGEVPVAERSREILMRILPQRTEGDLTVHAKTGSYRGEQPHLWLVGWVDDQFRQQRSSFALLLLCDESDVSRAQDARWNLAFELLRERGFGLTVPQEYE